MGGKSGYEQYLSTARLLFRQKPAADLCNPDELQFQIVHQVEELWMKLLVHTLIDVEDVLISRTTGCVIELFERAHSIQRLMTRQLQLLYSMSPDSYDEIR